MIREWPATALWVAAAVCVAVQVLLPGFIGIANNGDFGKVNAWLAIAPRGGETNFVYVQSDYVWSARSYWDSPYHSSESSLAWLATRIAGATHRGGALRYPVARRHPCVPLPGRLRHPAGGIARDGPPGASGGGRTTAAHFHRRLLYGVHEFLLHGRGGFLLAAFDGCLRGVDDRERHTARRTPLRVRIRGTPVCDLENPARGVDVATRGAPDRLGSPMEGLVARSRLEYGAARAAGRR